MEKDEIQRQRKMIYQELVSYLLEKYGKAEQNFFLNESCKSKNSKVTRANEGLYCHHIDEDKAIQLSHPEFARKNPFEYQKADRLVYCNIIEHLLLHIAIAVEPKRINANIYEVQGIGGAINHIIPQLNAWYDGKKINKDREKIAFKLVESNYNDYIEILRDLLNRKLKSPEFIGIMKLCRGKYYYKPVKVLTYREWLERTNGAMTDIEFEKFKNDVMLQGFYKERNTAGYREYTVSKIKKALTSLVQSNK